MEPHHAHHRAGDLAAGVRGGPGSGIRPRGHPVLGLSIAAQACRRMGLGRGRDRATRYRDPGAARTRRMGAGANRRGAEHRQGMDGRRAHQQRLVGLEGRRPARRQPDAAAAHRQLQLPGCPGTLPLVLADHHGGLGGGKRSAMDRSARTGHRPDPETRRAAHQRPARSVLQRRATGRRSPVANPAASGTPVPQMGNDLRSARFRPIH